MTLSQLKAKKRVYKTNAMSLKKRTLVLKFSQFYFSLNHMRQLLEQSLRSAPGATSLIHVLTPGVILVNTSGSLLKLLIPMMAYLWTDSESKDKYLLQFWPSIHWHVERTSGVSSASAEVRSEHPCGADMPRTNQKTFKWICKNSKLQRTHWP